MKHASTETKSIPSGMNSAYCKEPEMRIICLEFLHSITVKLCRWMQSGWREMYSRESSGTCGQGGSEKQSMEDLGGYYEEFNFCNET